VSALQWSRPALVGAGRLPEAELRERVSRRFPQLDLPPRPELDALVQRAALPFKWNDAAEAYTSTAAAVGGEQLTIGPSRAATVVSLGGSTLAPPDPEDPDVRAARLVQERLDASMAEGGFLALRVPTDRVADARNGLQHWVGHEGLVEVDLEALFLEHLRAEATRRNVVWTNVARADDPADPNWQYLTVLANAAVSSTLDDVGRQERVLAWFPGALVRHGAEIAPAPLDQLHDAANSSDGSLRLLWLVVLGGQTDARPAVDGTPVPIMAPGEWLDITDPWLKNAHRGATKSAGGRPA
jgi:hypothetical protein